MITEINEPKIVTKHISCKCECKFDGRKQIQIKNGIMINVDVSDIYLKKITFGIFLYVVAKIVNI